MMMRILLPLVLAFAVFGTGCTSVNTVAPVSGEVSSQPGIELIHPFAHNWTITETPLGNETYRLSLRARYFRMGGDGEALQIIRRRAVQLQSERGFSGYRVVDYVEGVESSTPFTFRVSEGVIQLVNQP